jgi:hypothetical protein
MPACDLWKYVLGDPHLPLLTHGYTGQPRFDEAILAEKIVGESNESLFESTSELIINPLDTSRKFAFGNSTISHSSLNVKVSQIKTDIGQTYVAKRDGDVRLAYGFLSGGGESLIYTLDGNSIKTISEVASRSEVASGSYSTCTREVYYFYENDRISEAHVTLTEEGILNFNVTHVAYLYVYDERGLLVERLEFLNGSFFPSYKRHYSYDDFGNISSIRANARSEDGRHSEIAISYVLDEYNRWVEADIELWNLKKVGDDYKRDFKRKSTKIRRLIRYRGDTSSLTKYAESHGQGIGGSTSKAKSKLEVHASLDRLEETMGQSLVVLVGKDGGCLAANNELSNLALILEAVLSGSFTVVSRSGLDEILEEQRLSMSGLVDERNAIEAGKLLGAEICLIVTAECVNNRSTLNVQALNSETSEILWNIVGIGATNSDVIGIIQNAIFQR